MKTKFLAVLLASVFLWTPAQTSRVAATQEVCPSDLGAYENTFTFDASVDSRRRRNILLRALTVCKYDFSLLRAELDSAYGVGSTIHVDFDNTIFIGRWGDETPDTSLNNRFGVKGSGLRGGSSIFLHELGHAVDSLVLTNENRRAITAAFCPTGAHQWWGGSYSHQTGEAFADAFAALYGGGLRPWQNGVWGHHKLTPRVESVIREILEGP